MHSVFSRLLRKFPESAHTLRRTQTLTTVGLFLAIQMVLSSYGTIQENAEKLIDAALAFGDVVSTGRNAPEWLRARADYVSEIAAQKHPFETEKLAAREGIEY